VSILHAHIMKIIFLGTRGYIKARTKKHYRHTSTLICYKGKCVMIDCGLDWIDQIDRIKPHAIILTHAHPDHAWGLQNGVPCPVYATRASWQVKELKKFPITQKKVVPIQKKIIVGGITFEAFSESHSLLCPGVGYKITAGNVTIYYSGDVVSINKRRAALKNVQLYIGDGATIVRPLVRVKEKKIFGHTTIRAQLGWCQKERIPRAIFTHCGMQIVTDVTGITTECVTQLARERNIEVAIAYDGMTIILR
jgi:phosphoribosyl 1,2-cyclic phosphodiesterase